MQMIDEQDTLRYIQSAQPETAAEQPALDETPMFPLDQRGSKESNRHHGDGSKPTDLEQIKRNLQALQNQQRESAVAPAGPYQVQ